MSSPPSVACICKEHGITRQAFYQARERAKRRAAREEVALDVVREERRQQPQIGTRKLQQMFATLFRQLKLGRDKLFDLLRREGLLVGRARRSVSTTNWWHQLRRFRNLIRDFVASGPDQLWVSDMTYVPVGDGFAYASIVMDAFSRRIVGYHLSDNLRTEGPLRALTMALRQARRADKLIHHSDQGVQYCSKEYVQKLEAHGCQISMTGGGNPYENAMAERVIGTIKNEYGLANGFNSRREARRALDEAVALYNHRRPHLALAYQTPDEVHRLAA